MAADGGRTCKQPVESHKRGDSGKDGQQTVENNSRGDREQAVFARLPVCSPENILPALPGDLPRRLGVSAAAWLLSACMLHTCRLVAATGRAESTRSGLGR